MVIDTGMLGSGGHHGSDLPGRLRLAWPQLAVVLVEGIGQAAVAEPGQTVLRAPFDLAALSQALDEAMALTATATDDSGWTNESPS